MFSPMCFALPTYSPPRMRYTYEPEDFFMSSHEKRRQLQRERQAAAERQRLLQAQEERANAYRRQLERQLAQHRYLFEDVETESFSAPPPIPLRPRKEHSLTRKRHQAASIIQRSFRRHLYREKAMPVLKKLRELKTLNQRAAELENTYRHIWSTPLVFEHDRVSFNECKDFLMFEDGLLRLMLSVDAIESDGNETVRDKRKNVVARIQALLDHMDEYKEEQLSLSSSQESPNSQDSDTDMPDLTMLFEDEDI